MFKLILIFNISSGIAISPIDGIPYYPSLYETIESCNKAGQAAVDNLRRPDKGGFIPYSAWTCVPIED